MELHIHDISKTYCNGVQARKDVTLTIPAGMYGLRGSISEGERAEPARSLRLAQRQAREGAVGDVTKEVAEAVAQVCVQTCPQESQKVLMRLTVA